MKEMITILMTLILYIIIFAILLFFVSFIMEELTGFYVVLGITLIIALLFNSSYTRLDSYQDMESVNVVSIWTEKTKDKVDVLYYVIKDNNSLTNNSIIVDDNCTFSESDADSAKIITQKKGSETIIKNKFLKLFVFDKKWTPYISLSTHYKVVVPKGTLNYNDGQISIKYNK